MAEQEKIPVGLQQACVNTGIHIANIRVRNLPQKLGVDTSANDGRGVQDFAFRWREAGTAGQHRILHRRGHGRAPRTNHLCYEERIAFGAGVEIVRIDIGAGRHRPHCFRRKEVHRHAPHPWGCCQVTEHDAERMRPGDFVVTIGEEDERSCPLDASPEEAKQVDRRLVSPMDVFDHQHRRRCVVGEGLQDRRE